MVRAFLFGAAAVAALLACSSDENKPPVNGDPIPVGSTNSGGGGDTDASQPQGSTNADGGLCSTTSISTTQIAQQVLQQDPPAQTGGTLVNGTYDLAADTVYAGTTSVGTVSDTTIASTVVIDGNAIEILDRVIDNAGTTTPTNETGTFVLSNVNGVIDFICPLPTSQGFAYTAGTDNTLTLFNTTTHEARTYRLRQ